LILSLLACQWFYYSCCFLFLVLYFLHCRKYNGNGLVIVIIANRLFDIRWSCCCLCSYIGIVFISTRWTGNASTIIIVAIPHFAMAKSSTRIKIITYAMFSFLQSSTVDFQWNEKEKWSLPDSASLFVYNPLFLARLVHLLSFLFFFFQHRLLLNSNILLFSSLFFILIRII
jgi:hypothetical protein